MSIRHVTGGDRCRLIAKPGDERQRKTIMDMDAACFPNDKPAIFKDRYWWIYYHNHKAAGYASIWFIERECTVAYFTRCGVLPKYRGRGIQRKLIKARVRYARRHGAGRVVTYTTCENCNSSNNLIACGFKVYQPLEDWAGKNVIYWQKILG